MYLKCLKIIYFPYLQRFFYNIVSYKYIGMHVVHSYIRSACRKLGAQPLALIIFLGLVLQFIPIIVVLIHLVGDYLLLLKILLIVFWLEIISFVNQFLVILVSCFSVHLLVFNVQIVLLLLTCIFLLKILATLLFLSITMLYWIFWIQFNVISFLIQIANVYFFLETLTPDWVLYLAPRFRLLRLDHARFVIPL